jgi:hypothetical protein
MTWYISIVPKQELMDLAVDDDSRSKVGFNVDIRKRPSATVLEEIYGLLAGVVLPSGRILCSTKSIVPAGDGPFITLTETGGTGPQMMHDTIAPSYPRPSMQILARARDYVDARAAAQAAYDVLSVVRNRDVPVVTIL